MWRRLAVSRSFSSATNCIRRRLVGIFDWFSGGENAASSPRCPINNVISSHGTCAVCGRVEVCIIFFPGARVTSPHLHLAQQPIPRKQKVNEPDPIKRTCLVAYSKIGGYYVAQQSLGYDESDIRLVIQKGFGRQEVYNTIGIL